MKQKEKHCCKTLGYERETPVKYSCGSSTTCRTLPEESLWRWHDVKHTPFLQWFCKTTQLNIQFCSIDVCHTTLIGRYENIKSNIQREMKDMWDLLQHFSGIEGR